MALVTVIVKFEHRKSEVEVESVIKRSMLRQITMDQLSCSIDDVTLKQYDEELKKWEDTSEELTLKEGMKFKLERSNPVGIIYIYNL